WTRKQISAAKVTRKYSCSQHSHNDELGTDTAGPKRSAGSRGQPVDDLGQTCRRRLDHLTREAAESQHQSGAARCGEIKPAHGANNDTASLGGGLNIDIG